MTKPQDKEFLVLTVLCIGELSKTINSFLGLIHPAMNSRGIKENFTINYITDTANYINKIAISIKAHL